MQQRSKHNQGFTLVEVLVTLVILVLLAGIGYSGVRGLVGRAEQNARTQVARTLFMAAQTALTHVYANDPTQQPGGSKVELGAIDSPPGPSAEWAKELKINGGEILYLVSNGGDGEKLLALLGPYLDDKTVLEHAIAIEYNRITGNVLSCFYSDETALSYGGVYDLYARSESALDNAHIGYFGVAYTGKATIRQSVTAEINALLVDYDDRSEREGNNINGGNNYGLLTLEIALPSIASDADPAFNDAAYVYDIELQSGEKNGEQQDKLTFSVGPQGQADIDISDIGTDLADALNIPKEYGSGKQAVLFFNQRPDAQGRRVLVLVLDSQMKDRGIKDLYPEIAQGLLYAYVEMKDGTGAQADVIAEDGAYGEESATGGDDVYGVHALFAGKDSVQNDEGVTEYYRIASVRHLNNLQKYGEPDKNFVQTSNIVMEDYSGSRFDMQPISSLSGSYDGKGNRIENLHMSGGTNLGLFAQNSGSITNLLLLNPELDGSGTVGGIAAVNYGTITNCTVYHQAEPGDAAGGYFIKGNVAGGIAGENRTVNTTGGTIEGCYVGVSVQGASLAGGIAGESSGFVTKCEVATNMSARDYQGLAGDLIDKPFYGMGGSTGNMYHDPAKGNTDYFGRVLQTDVADANQRWINVTNAAKANEGDPDTRYATGIVGGVVGRQTGGEVTYCVNAAHIATDNGAAGGVVGSVDGQTGTVSARYCYNAGWVQSGRCAGGVAGLMHNASIYCCYNTAPINILLRDNPDLCMFENEQQNKWKWLHWRYLPAKIVQTSPVAGGIVGIVHMNSSVQYSYNASYVAYPGYNAYAGAFGRVAGDSSVVFRSCYFLRNTLNCSPRYYLFKDANNQDEFPLEHYDTVKGKPCVTVLTEDDMKGLIKGGSSPSPYDYLLEDNDQNHLSVYVDNNGANGGAGPLYKRNSAMKEEYAFRRYYFPVLRAENSGNRFHRTPYYPIQQQRGQIELHLATAGESPDSVYLMSVWVPENTDVTLRLHMKKNDAYATHTASLHYSTTVNTTIDFEGITGTVKTAEALTWDSTFYTYGCRKMFVISIPASAIGTVTDLHAQLLGPSDMTDYGNIVWSEDNA